MMLLKKKKNADSIRHTSIACDVKGRLFCTVCSLPWDKPFPTAVCLNTQYAYARLNIICRVK